MSKKKQGIDYRSMVRGRINSSPKAIIGGLEQQSSMFREALDRSTAIQQEGSSYGVVDWVKDNYVKLQENRTATERDASVGRYVRAKEAYEKSLSDEQDFTAKLEYISINQELAAGRVADPIAAKKRLAELQNNIISRDGEFDSRITSGITVPFIEGLKSAKSKQEEFKSLMDTSLSEYKEWDQLNKEYQTKGVSNWFAHKESSTELSLLNSDSWLYRASGLIGSSMSSWKEQLAGIGFGVATSLGAGIAASAAGAGAGAQTGNPWMAAAGAGIAFASAVGSTWANYASRENESHAEVAQAYKSKFLKELEDDKAVSKDAVINKAKQKMVASGMAKSVDNITDDSAVDAILTDQIQIKDNEVNTLRIKAAKGLEDVYSGNMALSYSDYAQSAIQFLPVGKLLSKVGGTAARFASKKAPGIVKVVSKATESVNKHLDDIVEFGLTKNVGSLNKIRNRHAIASVLGKVVTTGVMEGAEEGTQYMISKKYMDNKYDGNMSPAMAFLENMAHGARATYAALTPWDPVYSSDKEFLENYKGGVMLGGLMTGAITTAMETTSRVQQNKYDKLASALYADHIAAKDDVITGAMYSKEARTGNIRRVIDGLSELKTGGYTGVEKEVIDSSIRKANSINSLTTSENFNKLTKDLGIDKNSDRYDLYASLLSHYKQSKNDYVQKQLKSHLDLSSKISTLIDDFVANDTEQIDGKESSTELNLTELNSFIKAKYAHDHTIELQKLLNDTEKDSKELSKITGINMSNVSEVKNEVNKLVKEYKDILKRYHSADPGFYEAYKNIGTQPDIQDDVKEYVSNMLTASLYGNVYNNMLGYNMDSGIHKDFVNNKLDAFEQRLKDDADFENESAWDERTDDNVGKEVELEQGQEVDESVTETTEKPAEQTNPTEQEQEIDDTTTVAPEKPIEPAESTEEKQGSVTTQKGLDLLHAEFLEEKRLQEEALNAEKATEEKAKQDTATSKAPTTQPTDSKVTTAPQVQPLATKPADTKQPLTPKVEPVKPVVKPIVTPVEESKPAEKVKEKKATKKDTKTKEEQVVTTEPTSTEKQEGSTEMTAAEKRKARIEELRKKIREDFANLNFGINPDTLLACVELTFYIVEDGVRSLSGVTRALYADFGEKVLPYVKGIYSNVRLLPESAAFKDEMDSSAYIDSIDDISQLLVDMPETNVSDTATYDRIVKEKDENDKLPIPAGDVQADTVVTETEDDLVLPEMLTEAVGALPEERVEGDEIPEYEPLVYNPDKDPFSHKLKVFVAANRKFDGYEDWETGEALDIALLDNEFLKRAEITVVVKDFKGTDAIYVEFVDGNKKYVASVSANTTSMKNTRGGYVYSGNPQTEVLREQNLTDLRNKIIRLHNWVKNAGNNKFRIVGDVTTSNGRFTKNTVNGTTVYTPIQDISLLGIPENPSEINEGTVAFGVADGKTIIVGGEHISNRGGSIGQKYLLLDPNRGKNTPSGKKLLVSVDSAHFSDNMAKFIIKLLLLGYNKYENTPLDANKLLKLIVHSGKRTIPTGQYDEQVTNNLLKKTLYLINDETSNDIVISNVRFTSESLSLDSKGNPINPEAYNTALELLMTNFTWNINRDMLYENIQDSQKTSNSEHPLKDFVNHLLLNNLDSFVFVPGELEFTAEDLGLTTEEDGSVKLAQGGGLNYLAWTIKNKRIVSDLIPNRPLADIWLYLNDVRIEQSNTKQVTEETKKATIETVFKKEAEKKVTKKEAETIVSEENKTKSKDNTAKQESTKTQESDNKDFSEFENDGIEAAEETVFDIISNDALNLTDTKNSGVEQISTSDIDNLLGAPMTETGGVDTTDIEKAKSWLASKLGLTEEDGTLSIVDDVMVLAGTDMRVIGLTKEDSIVLYELASSGVEFHEAWHRVSNLLITEKRRNKIYNKYRSKNKVDISDKELDEIFAEKFREFQLSKAKDINYEVTGWFRKAVAFIKTLHAVSDYKLAKLYYEVNMGRFKDVKPSKSSVDRFKSIYGSVGAPFKLNGVSYDVINSTAMFNDVVENLKYLLLRDANTLSDVNELKIARLKSIIKASARTSPLFMEVYMKFDRVFVPALNKSLEKMSINLQESEEANASELLDSGDGVVNSIQDHTVASYEKSKLDKARPIVKFIFGTIPTLTYSKDGKLSFLPSSLTGLPKYYDMNKAMNKAISKLCKCKGLNDLYRTVDKLAESDLFFKSLQRRLSLIKDEQTLTQLLVTVRSNMMIFDTLRVTRLNDENNQGVKLELVDNTADKKSYALPKIWSEQFLFNSGIFQQSEDGAIRLSDNRMEGDKYIKGGHAILSNTVDIYKRLLSSFVKNKPFVYNDVSYDLNDEENIIKIKHLLVAVLNRVGIFINYETLDDIINSDDYKKSSNTSQRDALNAFISSGPEISKFSNFINILETILAVAGGIKNQELTVIPMRYGPAVVDTNINSLVRNSGFVINAAQYHAKNNMSDEESMAYGANNNKLYKISSNNTITQVVDDLNRSKEEVNKLMSTVYAKGSLILGHISTSIKSKLSVSTFVNFRENKLSDGGRDYTDISPLEDYIAKMTAVFKDKIIFPTMADKKTYNLLSGVPLFHGRIQFSVINSKLHKKFNDGLLYQFMKYAADDLAAIELCIKQLDPESSEYLEPEKRIKNYHTGSKNGLKFRVITGVYQYINGKEVFVNFNDNKLTPNERIKLFKDTFYGNQISPEDKNKMICTLLSKEINEELKYAKQLGVIDFDYLTTNGEVDITKLRNVNLDTVELENRKKEYRYFTKDDTLQTSLAIYDMISDYTTNSIVSVIEVEKVFSGDPAFYKNTVDKIKRLGGLISTGVDNRVDFVDSAMSDNTYSCAELNDVEIGYHRMDTLTAMFTVADIKEALISMEKLSPEEADTLVSNNVEISEDGTDVEFDENFYKEYKNVIAAAKESAKKTAMQYSDGINVTDASVYVSPKMYENMMRRIGNWNSDVQLAFRILTVELDLMLSENDVKILTEQGLTTSIKYTTDKRPFLPSPANNWTSNPALYAMATKTSLNALKYTAFGKRIENQLATPYYNKMAIFPLFKTIAHGEAKAFYERMTKPGDEVDMLMFNSAVKVGSQGAIDPFSDYENGKVADLSKLSVYRQDFKYLRQQFPTDGHDHMEQMAGTQMLKQGLSNIDMSGLYGPKGKQVSGKDLVNTIYSVMTELSNREALAISNELFNKNGEVNEEALAKMLLEDAESSDANDNVISGLQIKDGKFKYPLSSMSDSSWLESRFIAYINKKVIDITLAGGAFIQRSPFGFRSDAGIVSKEGFEYLNGGKRLNMINPDGTMDAIISITMFKDIIPDYDKMTFEAARAYLFHNNIIGDNALPSVGYRIPTQSVASISPLKFVDVLPDIMADTIVLPEGFTKLTGSDHDVDKLFIARYEYGKTVKNIDDYTQSRLTTLFNSYRDESLVNRIRTTDIFKELEKDEGIVDLIEDGYSLKLNKKTGNFYLEKGDASNVVGFSDTNDNLSEKGLKNKLLDSYLKVLLTLSKANELKTPIDAATGPVKDILKDIESNNVVKKSSILEKYTPRFQEDKKQEYTTGKAGIGPMALNAAHHILTQLYDVKFRGTKFVSLIGIENVNGVYDNYENSDGSRNRILDWLSAMINAFVDMAKDPYIVRLNVTPWTYNITTLLLRAGFGKYTFYYLSQPILKEMSAEVSKYEGVYGIDSYKSKSELRKEAIKNVLSKYDPSGAIYKKLKAQLKEELKGDTNISRSEFLLNEILSPTEKDGSFLTRDLILNKKDFDLDEYNEHQVKMYLLWEKLQPYSQNLADLVKYSKVDTKKTGKTFFEQRVFELGVIDFLNESLFDDTSIRNLFYKSYIFPKMKNSMGLVKKIFDGKLLRTTKAGRNFIENLLVDLNRKTTASDKLCSTISRSMEAGIKAGFFADYMENIGITYEDILYGKNSTAVKLLNIRKRIYSGEISGMLNADGSIANTLLDMLTPEIYRQEDDSNPPNFIKKLSTFDGESTSADNIINSWRDLLDSDNAELKSFAEELVIYSFITSGDIPGGNSFFKYVPVEYKEKIGYNEYIREQLLDANESDYLPVSYDEVYRNNWFNDDLVKPVKFSEYKSVFDPIQGREVSFNNTFSSVMSSKGLGLSDIKYPIAFIGERVDGTAMNPIRIDVVDGKVEKYFPPFVKMRFNNSNAKNNVIVYKLHTYVGHDNNTPLYVATTKLGYKKDGFTVVEYGDCKFDEYSFDTTPEVFVNNTIVDIYGNETSVLDLIKEYKQNTTEYYILQNLLTQEEAEALAQESNNATTINTEESDNISPEEDAKDIAETQTTEVETETEIKEEKKVIESNYHTIQYTPTGKSRQTYTITGKAGDWHIMNKDGKEVFLGNSKDRNKILANLAIMLGDAKVVSYKGANYVVIRNGNVLSVQTGNVMSKGSEIYNNAIQLASAKGLSVNNKSTTLAEEINNKENKPSDRC